MAKIHNLHEMEAPRIFDPGEERDAVLQADEIGHAVVSGALYQDTINRVIKSLPSIDQFSNPTDLDEPRIVRLLPDSTSAASIYYGGELRRYCAYIGMPTVGDAPGEFPYFSANSFSRRQHLYMHRDGDYQEDEIEALPSGLVLVDRLRGWSISRVALTNGEQFDADDLNDKAYVDYRLNPGDRLILRGAKPGESVDQALANMASHGVIKARRRTLSFVASVGKKVQPQSNSEAA